MTSQTDNANANAVDRQRRSVVRLVGATGALITAAGLAPLQLAQADTDPRPEFAADDIEQVLDVVFGTRLAADDASIQIVAPLATEQQSLVPFEVSAPGADKIAVLFDGNPAPLIVALDQITAGTGFISARARLERSGFLHCYALRGDLLGRATRKVNVAGHWFSGGELR